MDLTEEGVEGGETRSGGANSYGELSGDKTTTFENKEEKQTTRGGTIPT